MYIISNKNKSGLIESYCEEMLYVVNLKTANKSMSPYLMLFYKSIWVHKDIFEEKIQNGAPIVTNNKMTCYFFSKSPNNTPLVWRLRSHLQLPKTSILNVCTCIHSDQQIPTRATCGCYLKYRKKNSELSFPVVNPRTCCTMETTDGCWKVFNNVVDSV